MNSHRILVVAAAGLCAALWTYACGDGATEPPPTAPDLPLPTTVAVASATVRLTALGATEQLTAEVRDQNGNAMSGAAVSWASSATAVATVSSAGLVTAAGNGTATITATSGSASGTAAVTVAQKVSAVIVSPAADTLVVGDTLRLAAEAADANGHAVAGAEFSWSSSNGSVATVDASGLVRGVAEGTATITAMAGSARDSAQITVANPDRAVLVVLYEATDGPNWVNNENWLTDAPLGEWYGVETDAAGRVVRLDLSGTWDSEARRWVRHGLTGLIPPQLGNLASLEWLNLSGNNLTGSIPPQLGDLASLTHLNLSVNSLTGPVPSELGNLRILTEMHLWFNDLQGSIPPEIGDLAGLTTLDLRGNDLSGPIPAQLGRLTSLARLNLWNNDLTGSIPPELGNLTRLTRLQLAQNDLSGPIPENFLQLGRLESFIYEENADLCAPGTTDFVTWLQRIENASGPYCNESDVRVMELLYQTAGGANWTNSSGWLQTPALEEWHGVTTNSLGRVVMLDLTGNGLEGRLPAGLGNLAELSTLRLGGNALSGSLPFSLIQLSLVELHYSDTDLCVPVGESFRAWLSGIASHEGTDTECPPLSSDREILVALYESTDGTNWTNTDKWLTDAPLGDWYGVETDAFDDVLGLELVDNNLAGPILHELGNLRNLHSLDLSYNNVTGTIPPELGNLPSLTTLNLRVNDLTGPIPHELGSMPTLENLALDINDLTGQVPPEFGGLSNLRRFSLVNNPRLSGALPASLTGLRHLETLMAAGTDLCAPQDPGFQAWLETIQSKRIAPCTSGGAAMAYLTQAVQLLEDPVPLVAGEQALLRVFVTAAHGTTANIPPVRARFYLNGTETHVANIPTKTTLLPTQIVEHELTGSANAEIPGEIVQPGLEIAIEIDPDETLDPGLGVARRIPETGRLAIDVREMPVFDLTVIPFLWRPDPDSAIVEAAEGMAAHPEGHGLLWDTRTLLPIGALDVTAHEPVLTSSNDAHALLAETKAIRAMEGGRGHYLGTMPRSSLMGSAIGVAKVGGWASFAIPFSGTIAHELGHNLSLRHAPCGGAFGPDPLFPYPDGSVGAWGYDFRDGGSLVAPGYRDLMTYCGPYWISDYHFAKALQFRLMDEGGDTTAPATTRSLLVWGGMDADSVPFLKPAFVVGAPPNLPDSDGDYGLTGRASDGRELFSLSFTMPAVADGDGSSSFAYVLPVRTAWEGNLASITLSGPGGSATLDGDSDQRMVILLNPHTGQVRGILRDLPLPIQTAADAAGQVAGPGLEVLFSRGIPGAEAWRR